MLEQTYAILAAIEERHWWYRVRRQILADFFERYVPRGPGLKILDAGSGVGANLRTLARFGAVTALDIHPGALAFARQKAGNAAAAYVTGDAAAPPFPDGSFDVVVALDIFEHIEDDRAAMRRMARVLRPGGRMLAIVPAFMFLWGTQDDVSLHKRRYTRPELKQTLESAGFTVVKAAYSNCFFFPVIYLMRRAVRLLGLSPASENSFNPSLTNGLCGLVYGLESKLLFSAGYPFGTSVVAVCEKKITV